MFFENKFRKTLDKTSTPRNSERNERFRKLGGGSENRCHVPSPSGATAAKFSGWSGTVHLTKNRKIESSEGINPKFSREWSPDIFSIAISSSSFFKPTNQETEVVEEKGKKAKKT
jgi:hypothetical protein